MLRPNCEVGSNQSWLCGGQHWPLANLVHICHPGLYTVRKEMKYSGETKILNELVHYTTRIVYDFPIFVKYHELVRVASLFLRYISFRTVYTEHLKYKYKAHSEI